MDTWSSVKGKQKTNPDAFCPTCKGAGFVHPALSSGEPDFSRVVPCHCTVKEKDKERQARLEKYSNLGLLKRLNFDNLMPEGRSGYAVNQERFSKVYEAARAFSENPKGWLVFTGPSGSGKTHLAAAIVNERIAKGQPALFKTVPDLLDDLRATFSPEHDIPYDQSFDAIRNAPLLILDDLGIQSSTPWAKEKLDQLLNHRFSQELPTVITTDIPLDNLDDRTRSRLLNKQLCQVFTLEEKGADRLGYSWKEGLELQKKMTFDSFDWHRINLSKEKRNNLEQAYRLALNYAKSPEGWLVFQGVTGCGKTHLASAIVNYRYQQGKPALFIVVPEFLDHLRSAFSPESKISYDQLFESVKTTPLLVFDDFGEQASTPWAQEKLYQVINYRYNAQLPTIVTTRLALEDIEERISSRFVDPKISTPFNLNVPDYRGDVNSQRNEGRTRHSRRRR